MSVQDYPHLFEPIRLGNTFFRNRIFGAPMGYQNVNGDGYLPESAAYYYERRARGGAASVATMEVIADAQYGRGGDTQMCAETKNVHHNLSRIAYAVSAYGAVPVMEIDHAGMFANRSLSFFGAESAGEAYGPVECECAGRLIKPMDEAFIERMIAKFVDAAALGQRCGYRMALIHAGHGWGLHQFLSPVTNTRTDQWGGSPENRARIVVAIIDGIHRRLGRGFPVEVRISGSECFEGGYGIEEGIRIARQLDGHADLIHVSAGNHEVDEVFGVTHPSIFMEDGCNVQYALSPDSMQYYVIEVNPRVSRSSALASKATGYPIAKVTTRIALGYTLDEIVNGVTGETYACAEPTLDYCVLKFPRWPFDKFVYADKRIGTKMKATGEIMAIGTNFESALLKAVRSLEMGFDSLVSPALEQLSDEEIERRLHEINTERSFVVAEALRRGVSMEHIHEITKIDLWFLRKVQKIVLKEQELRSMKAEELTKETLLAVKKMGFADKAIARWLNVSEDEIRSLRRKLGVLPAFRMVDTCGGEFAAVSPYFYSTYGAETEAEYSGRKTVVVLGSGPIRIGQGIEFDYCSVHCVWALKKAGFDTVIINNNPETVSTDFDTSDRLYFEPLTAEDVWNVLEIERPVGVVCQFGGQTAIKLAKFVKQAGYPILGTDLSDIDAAEDRELFNELLSSLSIPQPSGTTVFTAEEAVAAAERLGYPVLVRPSYVLGGQGMEIAYDEQSIREYMKIINLNVQEHPILVDKYLLGQEIEVDAICDGEDVLIPGIMEHIERAMRTV